MTGYPVAPLRSAMPADRSLALPTTPTENRFS